MIIRVDYPGAGVGWAAIDPRDLGRALYKRDDVTEPIPFDLVRGKTGQIYRDREQAEDRAREHWSGSKRELITFDEWKGDQ